MNVFDQKARERYERLRAGAIVSAWAAFALSAVESIESYNRLAEGKKYPASIGHKDDSHIVIDCPHGQSDPFSTLMITVSARVEKEHLVIECAIEEWKCSLIGPPTKNAPVRIAFTLSDDNSHLEFNGERFTPFKAAEHLLHEALLKQI